MFLFLSANSVFAVQNSGTYLTRITRHTCICLLVSGTSLTTSKMHYFWENAGISDKLEVFFCTKKKRHLNQCFSMFSSSIFSNENFSSFSVFSSVNCSDAVDCNLDGVTCANQSRHRSKDMFSETKGCFAIAPSPWANFANHLE
jgi:hypothetical protein